MFLRRPKKQTMPVTNLRHSKERVSWTKTDPMERQKAPLDELSSVELTRLLNLTGVGAEHNNSALFDMIYAKLHRIAASHMQREQPNHTLHVTDLVHEAYMELVASQARNWENRAHFYAFAATVMRHILVRYAKRKSTAKRGGNRLRTTLAHVPVTNRKAFDLLALDQALSQLEKMDATKARVVELRFLAGLSIEEVAEVTGRSQPSIYKDLKAAKGWLYHILGGAP